MYLAIMKLCCVPFRKKKNKTATHVHMKVGVTKIR